MRIVNFMGRRKYIFLYPFIFLTIILGIQLLICIRQNGMLSYPLDDSYIHMAIAKNIAKYGVWGITRFSFTSASSSILYSLILGFSFYVFGVHIWIPLVINWIAAGATIFLLSKWAMKYLSVPEFLLFSVVFIFLVPLPSIVIMGMEHTLQVLFCLFFIYLTFRRISGDNVSGWLYVLSAVGVVMIRYEGVFLVGSAALVWLFVRKDFSIALLLVLAIIVPVSLFGWYSVLHGNFFFPNSLLIKGANASGSLSQFAGGLLKKIYNTGLIYSLLFIPFLSLLLFPASKSSENSDKAGMTWIAAIIAATCVIHFLLARFGKPYRYEAYLIAMELMLIPPVYKKALHYIREWTIPIRIMTGLGSFFFLLPFLFRVGITFYDNISMKNIHDQQVHMALFIHQYFPRATVALNDIGAVAFYNDDVHIFDMVGLANVDVIRYHKPEDTAFLSRYTAESHVQIGLLYPDWIEWLGYKKPSGWKQLGSWRLTDNYIAGNPEVGIFSIDPAIQDSLMTALKSYSSTLPSSVKQSGLYVNEMEDMMKD